MKNCLLLVLMALAAPLSEARCDYRINVRFVYPQEAPVAQRQLALERARQAAVAANAEKRKQEEALRLKLAEIRAWHEAERKQMENNQQVKDQQEAEEDPLKAILEGRKHKEPDKVPDEE